MGIVAGAPMGGLVEADPDDRYGLAAALLHPLKPWFAETGYTGPIQATGIFHEGIKSYEVKENSKGESRFFGLIDAHCHESVGREPD